MLFTYRLNMVLSQLSPVLIPRVYGAVHVRAPDSLGGAGGGEGRTPPSAVANGAAARVPKGRSLLSSLSAADTPSPDASASLLLEGVAPPLIDGVAESVSWLRRRLLNRAPAETVTLFVATNLPMGSRATAFDSLCAPAASSAVSSFSAFSSTSTSRYLAHAPIG